MNIAQISDNLEKLVESFNKETFIFDLLLAYGTPKATISRLQQGDKEMLSEGNVVIKKKLYFKMVVNYDLQIVIDDLRTNEKVTKQAPRFIIVSDYVTLVAYDTKTDESLDIPILEIPQYYDFFLPWAGMEKSKMQTENIADVKAAERMAKLYDEITKDNPTTTHEEVHDLNVFLSRLLFCYFAEDTGIFDKDIFTLSVDSLTQKDGSDLNSYLDTLFVMMNTPLIQRPIFYSGTASMPAYLKAFPYVNGGLFRNQHPAPAFTRKSRQMLIECGLSLQWQDINPDIFGSMIQAVITPEHRGGLGMHYTSVPNIMKVIEPLFLDELKAEFESAKGNTKKLNELLKRIWKIKIFDPACGSGNFLIIPYKELRKLEMFIFKELGIFAFSEVNLGNFYGIELDDFAHEIATLSLWLAEHQMNQEFMKEFGRTKPALPLQETGNIVQGNACRIDWETVCPKNDDDEIFILGNPPYLGFNVQSIEQKNDLEGIYPTPDNLKFLDYIACWFLKAAKFLDEKSQFAFVTTNSICQGTQVPMLWPEVFKYNLEISFAYPEFTWSNNAKKNAGVICSIIGVRKISQKKKYIFNNYNRKEVKNINAYLSNGGNTIVLKRQMPLSKFTQISTGNIPYDGGNLILSENERTELITNYPESEMLIKKLSGSYEYINGQIRYCLWITDTQVEKAMEIPPIEKRIEKVKQNRLIGGKIARNYANLPYRFYMTNRATINQILIPRVSSIRREYIPTGFLDSETIISDSAQAIYDPELFIFSIINSNIHMAWVRAFAGRLKSDYRYSAVMCYNTFPFPTITEKQKNELEQQVYNILGEREKYSEKTLAQLYDPNIMPDGLREAHRKMTWQ